MKVADFGLATRGCLAEDATLTHTGELIGTPRFLAPEQARGAGRDVTQAADVFALGANVFALLTGRPPFAGKPMGELLRDVMGGVSPPPRQVAAWVPKPLDAVVRKAMAREAADLYPSALELAAEVDCYLADEPMAAHRESAGERARRWARRYRGWVQAGVVDRLRQPAAAGGGKLAGALEKAGRTADAARLRNELKATPHTS